MKISSDSLFSQVLCLAVLLFGTLLTFVNYFRASKIADVALSLEAPSLETAANNSYETVRAITEIHTRPFNFDYEDVVEEEAIPQAPEIFLRAVIVSGRANRALIDLGKTKGLIIKKGDDIPGGLGQVVRIDPTGITVRANGYEYIYELSKIELIKSMR